MLELKTELCCITGSGDGLYNVNLFPEIGGGSDGGEDVGYGSNPSGTESES